MFTLGQELNREIERYAHTVVAANPLFLAAERGALTAHHVANYVAGLRFLHGKTPHFFRRAERGAAAAGDHVLVEHYRRRLREEAGHERWADHDLSLLPTPTGPYPGAEEHAALGRLVKYLESVIDRDPRHFLAYGLLAEYFTVLVGPRWLRALENRCGVSASRVTTLANHIEADAEHAAAGAREIDLLVGSPLHAPALLEVVRTTISFFDAFWDEVMSTRVAAA
ncbi:MAG: hypothetical protein JOZ69_10635 [Myxococcales bacterium]|nr:hypothetical protein [Myxococcales bacterium]